MKQGSQKAPLIFEGVLAERYKSTRNKWIRLTIVSTLLPILFAGFVSFYNGSFVFINIFGRGEIILSLFALTIPMMFDLFEIKKENDERLSWAFFYCAVLVCTQILLYGLIRIDSSEHREIKSVISSGVMLVASWICCRFSIKALFHHSIANGGEESA